MTVISLYIKNRIYICTENPLTSLSWSSALAVGTREAWPAGWALLSLRSWGASPTRLSGWPGYCSDRLRRLDGDLVQYGVIARQVACERQGRRMVWNYLEWDFWCFENLFWFLSWYYFVIFYHKSKENRRKEVKPVEKQLYLITCSC